MIRDEDIHLFDFVLVEGREAQFSNVVAKVLEPSPKSRVNTEVQLIPSDLLRALTFRQRLYVQI